MQTSIINLKRHGLTSLAAITLVSACALSLSTQSMAQTDRCTSPFLQVAGVGHPGSVSMDPTQGELTIERINVGEPFVSCNDNTITIVMKVTNLDPAATGQSAL